MLKGTEMVCLTGETKYNREFKKYDQLDDHKALLELAEARAK